MATKPSLRPEPYKCTLKQTTWRVSNASKLEDLGRNSLALAAFSSVAKVSKGSRVGKGPGGNSMALLAFSWPFPAFFVKA